MTATGAPETPPLGLYVHFPWCVRKCPYCDFNSFTLRGELDAERYVTALQQDLVAQAADVGDRTIDSIFLGGGTPSLFQPAFIGRIIDTARRVCRIAAEVEVTLEANPGTIERGRFREYRAVGVNRVSLGAQSFDERALRILGRIHSPDETRTAAEELHAAGLDNFNLDLMYALPHQQVSGALADVDAALALAPAHLSHYQLTIEPGTWFAARPPVLPSDDAAAEMLLACRERMSQMGFVQYEVSAYARTGRRCAHNLNYWTFGDYLGIGAGAHGKLTLRGPGGIIRTVQAREPRRYLAREPSVPLRQVLAANQLPFEFMMNALRLTGGFPLELFARRTGLHWQAVNRQVARLVERELLIVNEAHVQPSPRGLLFLNDALLEFLPETPQSVGAFGMSTGR